MQIRVVEGLTVIPRAIPNVALEKAQNGSFSYPEYNGSRAMVIRYSCIRNAGSLVWSPVEESSNTSIAVQSVEPARSLVNIDPIWKRTLGTPNVSDRAPMLPVLRVSELQPTPPNQKVGSLVVTFRGMWPKVGRYSISYGANFFRQIVKDLEPYGEIFEYGTAFRLARAIAVQSSTLDIRVIEGGEITGEYIRDLAAHNMVERVASSVTKTAFRLKDNFIEGAYSHDVEGADDSTFIRSLDLVTS